MPTSTCPPASLHYRWAWWSWQCQTIRRRRTAPLTATRPACFPSPEKSALDRKDAGPPKGTSRSAGIPPRSLQGLRNGLVCKTVAKRELPIQKKRKRKRKRVANASQLITNKTLNIFPSTPTRYSSLATLTEKRLVLSQCRCTAPKLLSVTFEMCPMEYSAPPRPA